MNSFPALNNLSERVKSNPDFFQNTRIGEDGLLYCTVCGMCKQHFDTFLNKSVWCICKCQQKKIKSEMQRLEFEDKERRIQRIRQESGLGERQLDFNFARDDGKNPNVSEKLKKLQLYAERWEKMQKSGKCFNLLLFGSTGTGKTFAAYCVANALISKGVDVKITNFSYLIDGMQSAAVIDKNAFLAPFINADLLFIDDLGVERDSNFALQVVERVVDARYIEGKPFLITTNLPLEMLENPHDIRFKRIYDRILETAVRFKFEVLNRREEKQQKTQMEFMDFCSENP